MQSSYDPIAEWYDAQIRSGSLFHELSLPALLGLAGNVRGLQVCDLACGQGILSRALAKQGARVTGVDLSEKLLELARQYEQTESSGITYVQDDAHHLSMLADETFDGVFCHMALMDIPDLQATIQAVYRILRPQGWFVFVITHPCFQTSVSRWTLETDGTPSRVIRA